MLKRLAEPYRLLFRKFGSKDLHLSSIQIKKKSPLAKPRCTSQRRERRAEGGERSMGDQDRR